MLQFKRLMIGLDHSPMDQQVISYAAFLARLIRPEFIYFVHISKDLDVPDALRSSFPEMETPSDEVIKNELESEVNQYFPHRDLYKTEIIVKEGTPFDDMLRTAHIKNVDLLVVGRKKTLKGSGVLPNRLARKIHCSVFFVPEDKMPSIKEILIPMDFSGNSKLAFEEALLLAGKDHEVSIVCEHVYHLPTGYYKTGKTHEEFSQILRTYAQEKYNDLIGSFEIGNNHISAVFIEDEPSHIPLRLLETAAKRKSDLIIVGAKGKSEFAALLVGSVTEKLMLLNKDFPLLIVREKGQKMGFLEAIDKI